MNYYSYMLLVVGSATILTAEDDVPPASHDLFFYGPEEAEVSHETTTTTSTTTTTPEPPPPETTDDDQDKGVAEWSEGGRIHGSDEVRVFFRDCTPYRKDCLFGGPVCATDKRTYPNFMYMHCINYRRHPKDRVQVAHPGPCWTNPGGGHCPMDPVYTPVCGVDNRTYVNKLALECEARKPDKDNLKVKHLGECVNEGPCFFKNYTWEKPVCISNGRTIQSYQAVRCLRSLDSGIEIVHDGACTGRDLRRILKDPGLIRHRMLNEIEPFPVCGSDYVTYPSAAYVFSTRPHLTIEFDYPCNSPEHVACREAQRLDKEGKCKPVCGSDGKNYNSKHHLNCAKIVKTYLLELHQGPCDTKDSPCVRLFDQRNRQEPICGSDGVTYISPLAMECVAKYKKNGVESRHMGPCLKR